MVLKGEGARRLLRLGLYLSDLSDRGQPAQKTSTVNKRENLFITASSRMKQKWAVLKGSSKSLQNCTTAVEIVIPYTVAQTLKVLF